MGALLDLAAGVTGATATGGAVGAGVSLRRIGRANRVDPAVPSPAPRRWLLSPGVPAQLHRRLRRVASLVRAATAGSAPPPRRRGRRGRPAPEVRPLEVAGREIVARAVALDARVVAAGRTGRPGRWRQLAELRREVRRLEAAGERVAELAGALRDHLADVGGVGAMDLDLEMDAFEAALVEIGARPVRPPGARRFDRARPDRPARP